MIKNKRYWLKGLVVVALVLAGVSGVYLYRGSAVQNGSAGAVMVTVETGDIEDVVTAQGTLEPKDYVDVGAQVSGLLEALHVEIGDNVKTGDLIAEIDAEVFKSQVAGDEARLKTMQAQKLETEAEIRQARQKLERNKQLIAENAISREVFEDSQTALDIIEAQLMSLDAQIEEAQSTLEGNKVKLNYTKIYAPVDGTVVALSAKEGQTLNANQTTPVIAQIANLDVMTVKAQVAEADINKIEPAMPVYFTTLGAQNRRWQGVVRQILPKPEILNDVVLYNVLVDADNDDRKLMSGMTTQMFFVLGKVDNVPVIPTAALIRRAPGTLEGTQDAVGTPYLVRVPNGDEVTEQVVMIGLADRAKAQVLSGLKVGDKVALPSVQAISPDSGNARRRMPRL